MDERIAVLLDLLREIGGGDEEAGLAAALARTPGLWLGVPRDARVALPWEPNRVSGLRRFGAGAVSALDADLKGGVPRLTVGAVWRPVHAEPLWRAQSLSGHRRGTRTLCVRKSPPDALFSSPEEGQRWCDETLLAAGWVLL